MKRRKERGACVEAPPAVKRGLFTWLHHDVPVEYTWNLDERLVFIRMHKPPHEVAPRLAAIVAVPERRLPPEFVEIWRSLLTAQGVYEEACRTASDATVHYDRTPRTRRTLDEAGRGYDEANSAYQAVWCVYEKARRAHAPALLALARELAPEAPYDHEAKCLVFRKEDE